MAQFFIYSWLSIQLDADADARGASSNPTGVEKYQKS